MWKGRDTYGTFQATHSQPRYKEMWRPSNAAVCLRSGLYEAGGVVTWLNPLDNSKLNVDPPTFDQILQCEKRFVPQDFDGVRRMLFPFPIHCFLPEGDAVSEHAYPKTLFVIAGHAMVCAWWVPWLPSPKVFFLASRPQGGAFMLVYVRW